MRGPQGVNAVMIAKENGRGDLLKLLETQGAR